MSKIDILVNPTKRFHCDDYGDRKGCGQEVKLIKTTSGKTVACNPVQIPCYDREGNTVWAFVPHWATCSEQRGYFLDFMQGKAEENDKWARDKGVGAYAKEEGRSVGRDEDNGRSRRGPRRA